MKGNITKRGRNSWRLKFDAGRDAAGNRKIRYHTFRGSKREAQVKLAELIASVASNAYVEPTKTTVIEHVRKRITQWEAAGNITARTAARYRELAENQIAPQIGDRRCKSCARSISTNGTRHYATAGEPTARGA